MTTRMIICSKRKSTHIIWISSKINGKPTELNIIAILVRNCSLISRLKAFYIALFPCALRFLGSKPSVLNEPVPELVPQCRVGWLEDDKGTSLVLRPLTLNSAPSTTACSSER